METTEQSTPDSVDSAPNTTETPVEPPKGQDKRRGKSFELVADTKGAMVNGAIFAVYAIVCMTISIRSEPNSMWFYIFYFLTFMAVFQGGTIVLRHCLHLFPKSTVRLDIVGKMLRITRKNGTELELTRDIDYTRRKNTLVLQGKTHDNQSYNEVIREGAMADGNLDTLVSALKRFR